MLVLDEQLLGRDLERALGRWYRGSVRFITELRPGTIIKDDAIPALLRECNRATFLTINEQDFWRRVAIDERFCVICFALPDSRAREIPALLRVVLRLPEFRIKARRMGWALRVTRERVSYYGHADSRVRHQPLRIPPRPKP
jgi:hypothetical protein